MINLKNFKDNLLKNYIILILNIYYFLTAHDYLVRFKLINIYVF